MEPFFFSLSRRTRVTVSNDVFEKRVVDKYGVFYSAADKLLTRKNSWQVRDHNANSRTDWTVLQRVIINF